MISTLIKIVEFGFTSMGISRNGKSVFKLERRRYLFWQMTA